jgi:hypothetical protein
MRGSLGSKVVVAVGLVAGALALPALGAAGAGAASTPPIGTVVVLTNGSSGSTVVATVGETVVVELTGGPLRWSEAQTTPVASAAAPVLALVSGSTSSNGSSTTTFRVVHSGTASLQATGTPICTGAAVGCPTYVVLWHATVDVPVVDPPTPVA